METNQTDLPKKNHPAVVSDFSFFAKEFFMVKNIGIFRVFFILRTDLKLMSNIAPFGIYDPDNNKRGTISVQSKLYINCIHIIPVSNYIVYLAEQKSVSVTAVWTNLVFDYLVLR